MRNKFSETVMRLMRRAADARTNPRPKKDQKGIDAAAAGRWRADEARFRRGAGR